MNIGLQVLQFWNTDWLSLLLILQTVVEEGLGACFFGIPPGKVDAVMETGSLVEAIKRVSLVAERTTPVRLRFTPGSVAIEAGTGDDAQASEAVEVGTVTQRAFDAAAELVVNVFRSAAKRL